MIQLKIKDIPDVVRVGGKGLNLIRLVNAGVLVPNGFVVEAEHFNRYVTTFCESVVTASLTTKQDIGAIATLMSQNINDIVFDKSFIREIMTCFEKLGSHYVAVRSSAVSEDGDNASWAGQLSTELNVQQNDLEQAIKKCWASAFSSRALTYAIENNCKLTDISVAVVVQAMVESDVSGVSFSVNPVTNNKQEIVIEAAYGLGEAVVSGVVTPDEYMVRKSDLTIIDVTTVPQGRKISLQNDTTDWSDVPFNLREKQKLHSEEIIEIAGAVKSIERVMGYAADVEWAFKDAILYITQARPITGLR